MRYLEKGQLAARYILGLDMFEEHDRREARILLNSAGRTDITPFEAGLVPGTKIFLLRLRDWPIISVTLMSRWTGLDLAVKGAQRLFKK
jgi:hypothetical protein